MNASLFHVGLDADKHADGLVSPRWLRWLKSSIALFIAIDENGFCSTANPAARVRFGPKG
jgi:hypothetical protein